MNLLYQSVSLITPPSFSRTVEGCLLLSRGMMWLLPIVLSSLLPACDSYKILVYNPRFAHSHSNYMGSIADVLVEAGHQVTSFIPVMDEHGRDGTHKSTAIVYSKSSKRTAELYHDTMSGHHVFFHTPYLDAYSTFVVGKTFGQMFASRCRDTLEDKEAMEKLKNEKFDLMLSEVFDMCGPGLVEVLKPKAFIAVSSTIVFGLQYDEFGIPTGWSYNPSSYMYDLNVHSMWSRAKNIVSELFIRKFFSPGRYYVQQLFREKFGNKFPSLDDIVSNAAYVFSNSEPLIDFAPPTIAKVIYTPALGAKPPKPLDKYWKEVMEKRQRAVLISFGSVTPSTELRPEAKQAILKAAKKFPDTTFIWKYEKDDDFALKDASIVENVVLSKWTPQNDLLAHEKLAGFVSHGGMGSCMEAAQRGVPGVFMPLFGDQPRNAQMMQYNGMGKVLSKFDIVHADKLIALLREVLENKSYRERAQEISRMLAKKPYTSRDQLVKYSEFAAQFGSPHALRPQSHDMTLIEYYNLDVFATFTVALIVSTVVLAYIAIYLVKRLLRKAQKKSKTQ